MPDPTPFKPAPSSPADLVSAEARPDRMRLPDEVQALLLARSRRVRLAPGDTLFAGDAAPNALFGVISGTLRLSVASGHGGDAVIVMLEPGHWFGEVALLVGQERPYGTCALDASEIAIVSAEDFHRLIAARHDVHLAVTRLVCHRLRQTLAWIDDAIVMPLGVRLARRLLSLQAGPANDGTARLLTSPEELAFTLGVSPQSVNRQLELWEAAGLLSLRQGHIELLDRPALHARSEPLPARR